MSYLKLTNHRNTLEEVNRLEGLREQIYKSKDEELKREYERELRQDRLEKSSHKLEIEKIIKERLGFNEKLEEMAYKYYIDGVDWKTAYELVFTPEDEITEKEIKKDLENRKKMIQRCLQVFYNYGKTKKDCPDGTTGEE